MNRIEKGKKAEMLAIKALKRHKYKIIARNWRCRFGELDCVAIKDKCLIVVEVKSGLGDLPIERIDDAKRKRLAFLAQLFAKDFSLEQMPIRFDAAVVNVENNCVEIIEDAF